MPLTLLYAGLTDKMQFILNRSSLNNLIQLVKHMLPVTSCLLYPLEASGGYFGLASATPPPPRVERFSALTL